MKNANTDSKESPVSDPVLAYRFACERHAYELGETISRNNFFMVFQGVVFAGALNLGKAAGSEWIWVLVCLLGLVMSGFQFWMAASGRHQIVRAEQIAAFRELDVIASLAPGATRYHFYTDPNEGEGTVERKVSFGLPSYDGVSTMRTRAGLGDDKDECDWICHPIASAILVRWWPSKISIWVAIALFVFWLLMLVMQFVGMPPLPQILNFGK